MQWRIELLGGLRARRLDTGQTFDRFRSRRAAALLALLAYEPRPHPRELLAEMLWPGHDTTLARAHLRVVLLALRRLLEPPGILAGSVMLADRHCIGLQPAAITTDVAEFRAALHQANAAIDPAAQLQRVAGAVELYRGPLLPGYYEDWIAPAGQCLQDSCCLALRQLITRLEAAGEWTRAIEYAQAGIALDPLREEIQRDLIRLYAASGQRLLALRQYDELQRLLGQRLNMAPDPVTQELAHDIEAAAKATTVAAVEPFLAAPLPTAFLDGSGDDPTAPVRGLAFQLPLQRTRCYGRQAEIAQLRQLLTEGRRLVTLTGPGGSGKTRLAVELARALEAAWPGPVYFVPLADLAEARLVPTAIADALRLPRSSLPPLDQIAQTLNTAPTPVLLLLDNFEHLLPAGTPLLQWLLARVAHLQLLVTSRQELRLADEQPFLVPLLPVPEATLEPPQLLHCASVQLFYDRAQAAHPGFRITRHNAAAVAQLCARLEGLPLALELAAAQLTTLTPSKLLTRLEHRLDFRLEQPTTATYRYPTLRAALEWSYEPLWPELKRFFMRLGVFRGGFTIEAAAIVTQESGATHYLQQLRLASLVLVEAQADGTRFRLLETIREFALELLANSGEARRLRRAHANCFLDLAETAYPKLLGSPEQVLWLERLERDNDNLRAALAWLSETDPASGLRLAVVVARFWRIAGRDMELRDMLGQALQRGAAAPVATRIVALREMGEVLLRLGSSEDGANYRVAEQLLQASAQLSRQTGDLENLACALRKLGEGAQYTAGDLVAARTFFEESLAIERARGEPLALGAALHYSGSVARVCGDFGAARALYEESVSAFQEINNPNGLARAFTHLAALSYLENNPPLARSYWGQSLPLFREMQDKAGLRWALRYLSELAASGGDQAAARALLEERLRLNQELGNADEVSMARQALEQVARAEQDAATPTGRAPA